MMKRGDEGCVDGGDGVDEGSWWRWWMIDFKMLQKFWGQTNGQRDKQTNDQTDICDSWVAIATEKCK